MKKAVFIFIIIADLLFLAVSGCIPSKPTEDVEILPAERLVNKLEANRRRIRSFEGSGTMSIKSPQIETSASFKVVLEKPDSIYLSIMGPFGIELAQALVTKNNFIFYDALQNTAYKGKVDSDILQQIFKINLAFGDLMDAFVGSVNLTNNLYKPPTKYDIDYDKYVLTYDDSLSGKKYIYRVDIRELGITNYTLMNKQNHVLLEGKYSQFKLLAGVAVPYKIQVENIEENQYVTIDYKKMIANRSKIFIDFQLPSDATIIKW